MESLFITVLILPMYFAAAMESNCSVELNCNISLLTALDTTFCYIYNYGNVFTANVQCKADSKNYTFNCQRNKKWEQTPTCPKAGTYRSSGYLGCFEDYRDRILQGKMHYSTQNSGDYCKNICKAFRYAGTEYGYECFCGNSMRVKNARNGCYIQCPGNQDEKCGGHWQISIYDLWHIPVTTTSASTTGTTVSPNQTNVQDNTALSSLASSDGTGSVAIPVVFVFVVIVIALAAVIVFIIWRRKRLRSLTDTRDNSGTTDMHYQDLRPDHSAESEYTEYLSNNLNAEETAGAAYQTIDSLPEDQTECNSGYGNLKIHTRKSNADYYLNVAVNTTTTTASIDATYANTAYEENVL